LPKIAGVTARRSRIDGFVDPGLSNQGACLTIVQGKQGSKATAKLRLHCDRFR